MEKVVFNKLTIDRSTLTREKMDVGDFFFTFLYILGYRMEDLEEDMLKRGTAKFEFGKVVPTLYTIAQVKRMVASSNAPEMTKEDMLETIKYLSNLQPVLDGIKIQNLQLLKGTEMYEDYKKTRFDDKNKYAFMSMEEYTDFVSACLALLPKETVVHRMTGDGPRSLLVEPKWSTDKKRVLNMLTKKVGI